MCAGHVRRTRTMCGVHVRCAAYTYFSEQAVLQGPGMAASPKLASRSVGVRICCCRPHLGMSVGRILDASPHLPPPILVPRLPGAVCPLRPARFGYSATVKRTKFKRRSRALRNAKHGLLTRPDGRERPVSAPGRFPRFRPILGSRARMDGCREADADGAIGRIGPSHGAGACMGGRSRVSRPRHVRWPAPRRIASNGEGFARFRRDFAPAHALKTDAKCHLGGIDGRQTA